jgi:hypothetical protein
LEEKDIEEEVAVVVCADAVVDPGAVTDVLLVCDSGLPVSIGDSLIMLSNASLTPKAMLAPKRFPNHAMYTEILLVEFPKSE